MHTQQTARAVIEREMSIVRKLLGVAPSATITLHDDGWDSRVYEFEGRYFFKFPRSEKIRGRYAVEIAALKLASTISGVHIPEVRWRHTTNDYFGYAGIAGTPLSDDISRCSAAERRAIGTTLGNFLKQFHQYQLDGVRQMDLDREIAQLHEWYGACSAFLEQHCLPDERRAIAHLIYEAWPEELRALGRDAALCHGDFHLGNVIRSKDGELGIIDFGDVGFYDRSKDFIALKESEVFAAALAAYGTDEQLQRKIALRQKMWCIIELTARLGKDNQRGAHEKLTQLRTFIA